MLRSIFAPVLAASTDSSTFCAAIIGAVIAITIRVKPTRSERIRSNALLGNEEHFTNETLLVQIEENCRLEQWIVSSGLLVRVKGICFLRESGTSRCTVPQSEIRVDLSMCPNHKK